ncbi:Na+-transporting malonate decarboxylase, carboxybiotin decarboxylase subunit, madB, partial [Lactobacillus rhamnosus]|nr:Na+-transporting malonate decarboxylase, carboxybiotin decarboxylase subunit, madB [Lacticaseibacillus rhamnosus]
FATMAFVMFTAANIVPALLFIGAGLALLWILFHQRAKA